jgi:hypothetical protein
MVVGLVTTGTLFMMHDRYKRMMHESSSFGDRMLETACIIFFIPVILVPFTHWYECGKKARFINSWKKMQVRHSRTNYKNGWTLHCLSDHQNFLDRGISTTCEVCLLYGVQMADMSNVLGSSCVKHFQGKTPFGETIVSLRVNEFLAPYKT